MQMLVNRFCKESVTEKIRSPLAVKWKKVNLVHIDRLYCISPSEDYSMVLVLRLPLTKLGVPRKFNRVYFLFV